MEKEVKVPYIPNQCKDAVSLAQQLSDLVDKYEAALAEEDSIQAAAHAAIVAKQIKELNDARQRQIRLKAETVQLLFDVRDKRKALDGSLQQCEGKMTR